ncbi:MAG: hypothetical protein LBB77_06865, partial [Treponema sp.]|nr:hypothetical protein [Treponema sp.]
MPVIKVHIAPSILDWIGNVASFEGVNNELITHFYKWKAKEEQPTYAQIETLSDKIHIPLGYFFLQSPPDEPLPLMEYRTIQSAAKTIPGRDLMDTYYQMSSIQDWMRDYLIDSGSEKRGFVGPAKRALDNNYINRTQYEKIASDLTTDAKKRKKGNGRGNYYNTAISRYGKYFILALDNSIREG